MAARDFEILDHSPSATTTDQVFDLLHRAVVSLELPPRSKISEAEIARRLDVSRQPVRDAFFRLSKLGFLQIRPQRATLVTPISIAGVRQAAFVRTALEVACVRAAAERATASDGEDLDDLLEQQRAAIEARDTKRFHALDDAFHARMCAIAGHPYVWPLIEEQKAHMDRVRFLSLAFGQKRAYDEHREIAASIAAHDPDRAAAALRGHLGRIEEILRTIRAEHAAYFEDDA